MKKRTFALLLALVLLVSAAPTALALDAGVQRVTLGANLTDEQRAQIYKDFGIDQGSVKELQVTNTEERNYLSGLVSDNKIGNAALSCVYIKTLPAGSGLKISTNNINWCSKDMYVNALTTAGISDAEVRVSAPYAVSGTAALTGLYKAYEDITGKKLDTGAKSTAVQEIVVTGNLAQLIGNADATELVNQLKLILDKTRTMSDDEVRAQIREIAKNMNISLTDSQMEQVLSLCRSLEKLDSKQLAEKVEALKNSLTTANKVQQTLNNVGETATKVWTDVKGFFVSAGNFIANLFK